ncbi:MAG: GAF domain-containing protein [Ilumatobacter sp.]|nr:GAF domain-containing protein [Ilumatobacter sp.]
MRTEAETIVVLDCGTGAHGLGKALTAEADGEPITGHILISHTHWDHIQGLPFFEPLFNPGNVWHVYGPTGLGTSIGDTLSGQMQYSYFPVSIEQLGGVVDYHDLVEGSFVIDDVKVSTHYLNHPALTLGYRLEADGATVVYASDHEPHHRALAHGGDVESNHHDAAHARFIEGADLLIHDSQYCAAEYAAKAGWGHSTVEYVIDVARHANVARVALFHHDPTRTDDDVDELLALAQRYAETTGYTGEIFAAAEGPQIDVVGTAAERSDEGRPRFVATETPAIEASRRSILIATTSPKIEATLREAAAAEQFEIWTASDRESLLETLRTESPALVLIEDGALGGADVGELADAIRELDRDNDDDVSLVVIGGSGVRPGTLGPSLKEWMVWPASLVYVRTKLRAWLLRRACRWQNAPLPDDEEQRLATLHDLEVLDTEPEDRFDELTAEASDALDVPVALVSLVDTDRQWFKSRHGIDAAETPRDMSFCAHAVASGEALQVPDALLDDRFADNPLVQGDPHVRFYAGAPLTMSDGTHAGTLCVLDYRPRLLTEQQITELERLAGQVAKELETK